MKDDLNIRCFVKKEIFYNKLFFIFEILSVVVAVAVCVAIFGLLQVHDIQTEKILQEKEGQIKLQINEMDKEYRKIAIEYGFNMVVLSSKQNKGYLYDKGFADKFFPENYIEKLISAKQLKIEALTAVVIEKVRWLERQNRNIFICGTEKIDLSDRQDSRNLKSDKGNNNSVGIGYELWKNLGIKKGDDIKILRQKFIVDKLYSQVGSKDDITIKMSLINAQKLLDKQRQINELKITRSYVTDFDFNTVKNRIEKFLPNTQVVEMGNKVSTMKKTVKRAEYAAKLSMDAFKKDRASARGNLEYLACWIIPVVLIAAVCSIILLTLSNLRRRNKEIAIFRVLGYRAGQVSVIFLTRAFIVALVGAVIGVLFGLAVLLLSSGKLVLCISLFLPLTTFVWAVLLTLIICWLPIYLSVNKDPAIVLR